MALIICPECKKQFSDTADACPNCGYVNKAKLLAKAAEIQAAKSAQERKVALGCLTFIGILVLWGVAAHLGGGGRPSDSAMAWVMAKDFVTKRLKDPTDADFGSLMGDFQSSDDVVTSVGDGRFHVHAWVDAKNSFGGKVRTHFDADLQYDQQDKTWQLVSLIFDE
jgi:hypothetical protein